MKNIMRALCIITAFTVACFSFSSCGSDASKKKKIERQALKYVDEKYGFKPEVTNITFQGGGDLVPPSQRKSGGIVNMKYDGREFWVMVHLDSPQNDADNYQRDEIEQQLTAYLKEQLKCDAIYCEYQYDYVNGQIKEVKTWKDMFECGKYSRFDISISACGLDKASVTNFDTGVFGSSARIFISDWSAASEVTSETAYSYTVMPEPQPGMKAYYYFHDGTMEMKDYTV